MNNFYKWIDRNINRICLCTMLAAMAFIFFAFGTICTVIVYEPKTVEVEKIVEIEKPIVEIRYATEEEEKQRDLDEIEALAKTVWGEARGCSDTQKAAVVWCILNRVDSDRFPNDIISVITAQNQFEGYSPSFPVEDDILALVIDVLDRYALEQSAVGSVGRVLPSDYFFFRSNGRGENVFRKEFGSKTTWNWKWGTPYND